MAVVLLNLRTWPNWTKLESKKKWLLSKWVLSPTKPRVLKIPKLFLDISKDPPESKKWKHWWGPTLYFMKPLIFETIKLLRNRTKKSMFWFNPRDFTVMASILPQNFPILTLCFSTKIICDLIHLWLCYKSHVQALSNVRCQNQTILSKASKGQHWKQKVLNISSPFYPCILKKIKVLLLNTLLKWLILLGEVCQFLVYWQSFTLRLVVELCQTNRDRNLEKGHFKGEYILYCK